jgi:PWWP domain.
MIYLLILFQDDVDAEEGGGGDSCSSSSASDEECPSPTPEQLGVALPEESPCVMSDGNNPSVGDIVWGKVHGFPWWPGKVSTYLLFYLSCFNLWILTNWF